MPVSANAFVSVQTPKMTPVAFVQGVDAPSTFKTLCTAGANGSKVVSCMASTSDTSADHNVVVAIQRAGINFFLNTQVVLRNSGLAGNVPNVNLLGGIFPSFTLGLPIDSNGQQYLFLESGDSLVAEYSVALTAATALFVITIFGNF